MAATAPLSIAGGIMKIGAAQQQAHAQADAANYNAYVNEENAKQALQASAEQERMQRSTAEETIGKIEANYGASGVKGNTGSAMDVLQESARNAEMDALNIRHAGAMKAWAYHSGAALDVAQAANAHVAGNYSVASALISSISGAAASAGGAGG